MQVLRTPEGTRFGLWGERPPKPAPTLFVIASALEKMESEPMFTEVGRQLACDGFLYVAVDPPCHGEDRREDEPAELDGWAHRIANGEDLLGPFMESCRSVIDFLIAEEYSCPEHVAAVGTSRGGFCALHLAAVESRIRAMAAFSPVTELTALSEFSGLHGDEVTNALALKNHVAALAGRPVWLTIGYDDTRVSTDACVELARELAAANGSMKENAQPVQLVMQPDQGHTSTVEQHRQAAEWLRKNCHTT